MARRKATQPPRIVQKEFTAEEIERGIERLRRRIEGVESLQDTRYNDQQVYNLESDIRNTILELFGEESQEFREHGYTHINHGSMYMGMPESESQSNFLAGIPRAVEMLEGLIKRLEEKRGDLTADPIARAHTAFQGIDLHKRVEAAAGQLYRDGHYSDAVFAASKALINPKISEFKAPKCVCTRWNGIYFQVCDWRRTSG